MSLNYNLVPGTTKHTRLLNALQSRLKMSHQEMSKRYYTWSEVERSMRMWLPESALDAKRRAKREGGVPDLTTIYVPHTYATVSTFHTYATSVFLGRRPVMQFSSRHGEGHGDVPAVEALMDYQLQVGKNLPPLYIWLHDALKYGLGIICEYWDEEEVVVSSIEEEEDAFLGIFNTGRKKKVRKGRILPGYQGNRLYNVRPQDWFPDPRVPLNRFHDGEFCGRYFEEAWSAAQIKASNNIYMNLDVVKAKLKDGEGSGLDADSQDRDVGHHQAALPNAGLTATSEGLGIPDHGFLRGYEMNVRLVPSQWGLGDSNRVELWSFSYVRDCAIIKARPHGAWHGRFPFEVLPFEMDGYAFSGRGLAEMVQPIEDGLSWLLNSHLYNVRKELNGTIIYDPMRIDEEDILDPDPGKRVALKPGFMGTDVRQAMYQFQGQDMTRSHIQDMQVLEQLSYRVFGVNEGIMGALSQGGRKTATEVRQSSTFGINRLKTTCEYWSNIGFGPLAQKMLQNTQQYYNGDMKLRLVKDLASRSTPDFVQVNPESISGFYDFVSVDGTLPVDKLALAALWKDLLVMFRGLDPRVTAQFDIVAIIGHAMQLAGAPDIQQFKVKQLAPGQEPPPGTVPVSGERPPAPPAGPPIVTGMGAVG